MKIGKAEGRREFPFTQQMEQATERLYQTGAFLTTKAGDTVNTMTIAWGSIGFLLGKPVFTVAIRVSRYTHELLRQSGEFTVSIPLSASMDEQLKTCGTRSGRDVNKIEMCGLSLLEPLAVNTPVIGGCELHYECKVLLAQELTSPILSEEVYREHHIEGNPYVCYFGEIVASYKLDNKPTL